jgi:fermentation-respiration switch protein FrsA (DUF1100 family)
MIRSRITSVRSILSILAIALALNLSGWARGGEGKSEEVTVVKNGWDRHYFEYKRPQKLIVEESTPTEAQLNFWMRPPQVEGPDAPEPTATGPAQPVIVGGVKVVHLRFKDALGGTVPALLSLPAGKKGPFPLVIAIHGLTSNKTQVSGQVGPTLSQRGFAVLAADLPCHGERPGNPMDMVDGKHRAETFQRSRQAVIDVRQLIDLAEQRPDLDTRDGVVLAGYSLGSWISSIAGAADPRVRAMVLMVGGALDISADALKTPQTAATDPRLALAHFAGRPLLLLNGKSDFIVAPDWARRLYAAAPDPKKQIWYEGGHLLPKEAYDEAARWIAELTLKGQERKAG